RLQEQRRALPGLSGVLPHAQAAMARGVGQERSVLPPARRRGLQARHPEGCRPVPRHRPLRARNPRRGDRDRDPGIPFTLMFPVPVAAGPPPPPPTHPTTPSLTLPADGAPPPLPPPFLPRPLSP